MDEKIFDARSVYQTVREEDGKSDQIEERYFLAASILRHFFWWSKPFQSQRTVPTAVTHTIQYGMQSSVMLNPISCANVDKAEKSR